MFCIKFGAHCVVPYSPFFDAHNDRDIYINILKNFNDKYIKHDGKKT